MALTEIISFDGFPKLTLNDLSLNRGDPVLLVNNHPASRFHPSLLLFNYQETQDFNEAYKFMGQLKSNGQDIVVAKRNNGDSKTFIGDHIKGILIPEKRFGVQIPILKSLRPKEFATFFVDQVYTGEQKITHALNSKDSLQFYAQIWPNILGITDTQFKLIPENS
jgi:hypothetical protein